MGSIIHSNKRWKTSLYGHLMLFLLHLFVQHLYVKTTFSFTSSVKFLPIKTNKLISWKKGNDMISGVNRTISVDFAGFSKEYLDNNTWREIHVHQQLMDVALDQARQAGDLGEVPIGAIIVIEVPEKNDSIDLTDNESGNKKGGKRTFNIISYGQNQIETIHDASAHAELQAMRSASTNIQNWRLLNTTLYSTLEPCPMCLSAAQAFRVSKVVYGAPDLRLGAIETHMNLLDVAKHPFHNNMEVWGGIRRKECGQLLVDFFRERRKQKKKKKARKSMGEDLHDAIITTKSTKANLRKRLFRKVGTLFRR